MTTVGRIEAVLVAAAILPIVALVAHYGVNVPVGDQWELVTALSAVNDGNWAGAKIFGQHNEHRIVLTKLIMLGLAALTGWDVRAEMAVSIILAVITLLVLLAMLRPAIAGADIGLRLWSTAFVAATVFSFGQYENWLWGWQIQWFLSVLGTVVACSALGAALERRNSWPWLLVAITSAVVVHFSIASGVALWPAGLLILWLHPRSGRLPLALAWLAAAAASTALFFRGYVYPPYHPSPLTALADPAAFVIYLGNYLVGPLPHGWWIGLALGMAVVIGSGALLLRPAEERTPLLPWVGLAAFAVANAVLTGIGRVGFGAIQGTAPRYATIAQLALLAMVPLTAYWLGRLRSTRLRRGLGFSLVLAASLLLILGNWKNLPAYAATHDSRLVALDCLKFHRVATDACMAKLYPDPNKARMQAEKLEKLAWSGLVVWQQAAETLKLADSSGEVAWRVVMPAPDSGWIDGVSGEKDPVASGWARHPGGNVGRERRVIVVAANRVVGEARLGGERPDVMTHFRDRDLARAGWSARIDGWASGAERPSLRAYLILDDGRLQQLNGEIK